MRAAARKRCMRPSRIQNSDGQLDTWPEVRSRVCCKQLSALKALVPSCPGLRCRPRLLAAVRGSTIALLQHTHHNSSRVHCHTRLAQSYSYLCVHRTAHRNDESLRALPAVTAHTALFLQRQTRNKARPLTCKRRRFQISWQCSELAGGIVIAARRGADPALAISLHFDGCC